jgi:RNase P subunit RPR2
MVLTHLLSLSANDRSNYQVKSISYDRLQSLKEYAKAQAKINPALKAHYNYAIYRIDNPKDVVLPDHVDIAPGAPIGCY